MIKAPKFWYKENLSIFSILLMPLNILWIFGGYIKKSFQQKKRVNIPVISIGSAIIGGSGKTPTVLFICDLLKKIGFNAQIVSKGYGGNFTNPRKVTSKLSYQEVGDEALMMAAYHTTWVSKNRYQGCKMAEQDGADIVVLDDGLQNTSIHKDLSIYAYDGVQKFGNKFLVPAGPLRENIKKAVNKCSIIFQINEEGFRNEFDGKFKCFAKFKLEENHYLEDKKIIAFAGLGFNKKFFDQLNDYGFNVVKKIDFPDHHQYSVEDLYSLLDQANSLDAHLLTTEKDFIRIPNDFKKSASFIKGHIELNNKDDLINELKKMLLKKIIYFIEFLTFKVLQIFFNLIGFDSSSKLGGFLFKIIGPHTKYFKIIKKNMSLLFIDDKKLNFEAIRNLESTGKTFCEFFLIKKSKDRITNTVNKKYLENIMQDKESYIFISAHYGNWEITRNYLINFGFDLHSVYRHANNKLIDNEIQKIRKMPGSFFYPKGRESAKHMIKAIKNNKHLAILIDQKDSSGVSINFFNKIAKTNTGFASLALKYKKNICPIHSIRKENGSFEIIVNQPVMYSDFKSMKEKELTELIYKNYIEEWIKKEPSQWLWAHKRWM